MLSYPAIINLNVFSEQWFPTLLKIRITGDASEDPTLRPLLRPTVSLGKEEKEKTWASVVFKPTSLFLVNLYVLGV